MFSFSPAPVSGVWLLLWQAAKPAFSYTPSFCFLTVLVYLGCHNKISDWNLFLTVVGADTVVKFCWRSSSWFSDGCFPSCPWVVKREKTLVSFSHKDRTSLLPKGPISKYYHTGSSYGSICKCNILWQRLCSTLSNRLSIYGLGKEKPALSIAIGTGILALGCSFLVLQARSHHISIHGLRTNLSLALE